MEIVLYSTHCPRCKGVEMLLKKKNIQYIENNNEDEMMKMGFHSAPVLVVDGKPYEGKAIYDFINSQNN